jgi:hypothetical protein
MLRLIIICTSFCGWMVGGGAAVVPLGISFTPGGLLFPWHVGVAQRLQELNYLNKNTPIAGASAGALCCAVIGTGMQSQDVLAFTEDLCDSLRKSGRAQFRMKGVLEKALMDNLPDDAHTIISERPGSVGVAITELSLSSGATGVLIKEFYSKSDLVQCLLGSCNVPFWFHYLPVLRVRNAFVVDGFFGQNRKYFGAPEIECAESIIRVCALPSSLIGLESTSNLDTICPDILGNGAMRDMLALALEPGSQEQLQLLYDMGYSAASEWHKLRESQMGKELLLY